jgi:hypothetical protein
MPVTASFLIRFGQPTCFAAAPLSRLPRESMQNSAW